MKILMTQAVQGSLDGLTVQLLEVGATYETVDSPRGVRLAHHLIKQGVAVAAPAIAVVAPLTALAKPVKRKGRK